MTALLTTAALVGSVTALAAAGYYLRTGNNPLEFLPVWEKRAKRPEPRHDTRPRQTVSKYADLPVRAPLHSKTQPIDVAAALRKLDDRRNGGAP